MLKKKKNEEEDEKRGISQQKLRSNSIEIDRLNFLILINNNKN